MTYSPAGRWLIALVILSAVGAVSLTSCATSTSQASHVSKDNILSILNRYGGPLYLPKTVPSGYRMLGAHFAPHPTIGAYDRCILFQRVNPEKAPTMGSVCTSSQGERIAFNWIPESQVLKWKIGLTEVSVIFLESDPGGMRAWNNIQLTSKLDEVSWFGSAFTPAEE